MKKILALALGGLALLALGGVSQAAEERRAKMIATADAGVQPRAKYHRKRATRVYSYAGRRGGYSYTASDVINTYGQSRVLFGANNSYRDPFIDRQTSSGPFDHGFFFDSGIAPRGGDSPYMR